MSKVHNVQGQFHHHVCVVTPCASSFPHTGMTYIPQMNAIPTGYKEVYWQKVWILWIKWISNFGLLYSRLEMGARGNYPGNFHPWKFSEKCLSKMKCHTNTSIHLNHKVTHSLLAEEFKIIKKNKIITCILYLSCNYQNRNYLIRPWTILISNNIHWKIKSYTVKLLIREDNI